MSREKEEFRPVFRCEHCGLLKAPWHRHCGYCKTVLQRISTTYSTEKKASHIFREEVLMGKEKAKTKLAVPKTRLIGKEYSPLVIRRYSMPVLHFVAMISDHNLDDLDVNVDEYFAKNPMQEGIQAIRNSAGGLCDFLYKKYPRTEGVAVIIQADKMTVSSLSGDFMNHLACRVELYNLLTFVTGV